MVTTRVGRRYGGACQLGCRARRGRLHNSIAGVRPRAVTPFSILYTKFPYRPFDGTNTRGNFGSGAEKGLFCAVVSVLSKRPRTGFVVLRGIHGLTSGARG